MKPAVRPQTLVNRINLAFRRNCGYPAAIIRAGERWPCVSAETCCGRHPDVADYYRGWIDPKLAEIVREAGYYLEWETAGSLLAYPT